MMKLGRERTRSRTRDLVGRESTLHRARGLVERESTRRRARDLAAAARREDVRRDMSRLFRDLRILGRDVKVTQRSRRRWPALAGMAALAGAAGGAAWWLRRHEGEAEVDLGRTAHMPS